MKPETAEGDRAAADTRKGLAYAVSAYSLWGLLPVYWKALGGVGALEILAHRTAWSLVFVSAVLVIRRDWRWRAVIQARPRLLLIFLGSGAILATNWLTYIWGVNSGQIVETSLGYFINPLMYVLLGVIVLHERMGRAQVMAVGLAAAGVLYLTVNHGSFPWIAMTLATTFALYGLLRKIAPLGALEGLAVETAALCVPAAVYIAYLGHQGSGSFASESHGCSLLLLMSGCVTAFPLLLFTAGARRLPLATVGILQYIAPTLQLLLGVLVYREPFGGVRAVGFGFVWCALLLYTADGLVRWRRGAKRHRKYGVGTNP
ncbi:EamA family transporter RarD [Candidatus Fermentibacteria bacterium]|nr:EamA family transporter RarD [Candidatus Fermentibacteria bacterium]